MRKAAAAAPEGIASIGADSWSVDYVRLAPDGKMLREPFCYRDERTAASKEAADRIISPFDLYQRTGAYPHQAQYRVSTDGRSQRRESIARAPWVMLPEFVLYWLSGRRVAEYTNATPYGTGESEDRRLGCGAVRDAGAGGGSRAAAGCDGDGAGADDRDRWRSWTHFARRRLLRRRRTTRRARLRAFPPI